MSAPRDFPPAVLVHRAGCPQIAGLGLPQMPTAQIAREHPNGRQCQCYHFTLYPVGVVELVLYPPHRYEPSSVGAETYPGISRNLCTICGGTTCAGIAGPAGTTLLPAPPGARVVAPPPRQDP